MPNSALPPHLQGKRHKDYIFPFSLIPRAWTSYKLFQPPIVLFGYKVYNWMSMRRGESVRIDYKKWWGYTKFKYFGAEPCQRIAWSWYIGFPWYFTWVIGDTGWYIRVGFRWDSVDFYYTFPSFLIGKMDRGVER